MSFLHRAWRGSQLAKAFLGLGARCERSMIQTTIEIPVLHCALKDLTGSRLPNEKTISDDIKQSPLTSCFPRAVPGAIILSFLAVQARPRITTSPRTPGAVELTICEHLYGTPLTGYVVGKVSTERSVSDAVSEPPKNPAAVALGRLGATKRAPRHCPHGSER